MAEVSTTPLPGKLGIRAGSNVRFLTAPKGFIDLVQPLPDGVRIDQRAPYDVIVVFTTSAADLERRFKSAIPDLTDRGGLWVAWPKKTSSIPTDLDLVVIQRICLPTRLVDNKSCRIDDDWQAMRFVRRLAGR